METVTAICSICGDISDGLHFSVYTCRACAAFFRRTVSLKLEYVCRSEGNCQVDKSARNMCRSCRFHKCLGMGMQSSAVQQSRDGIGKRKESHPKETLQMKKPMAVEPTRPSSSEGFYRVPDPTSYAPISSHFSQMTLRPSNFESAKKVCQMEAHLVTDIINNHFHPFFDLPFNEKVLLFKNFFCYLSHTDRAYQSYKNFGNNPNDDRLMMPDGGFIKLSDLESFYKNAKSVKASPEEAARIFRPAMQYIIDVIIGHMRRIHLSELEYIAILGLFLWNEGVPGISHETIQVIHDTQIQIFNDLHAYYRQLGLEPNQITAKTGLLMMVMPKLTRSVVMMRDNFELAELFNIFEADICCKSFKNATVD